MITETSSPSRVKHFDAASNEYAERADAVPISIDDQRARSMSAHPSSMNHRLVERVESLHQAALRRPASRHRADNPTGDTGITLALHGDLNATSVPDLQGVLHALALLQPGHLNVDLSQVGHVSRESLRLIERSGEAIGSWSLFDPSPLAYADLVSLGRSELIASETDLSATA